MITIEGEQRSYFVVDLDFDSFEDISTNCMSLDESDAIIKDAIAKKYGLYLSRAGNGICHTVHFERFDRPGMIALGSDSHTPTGSAIGALAIGSTT